MSTRVFEVAKSAPPTRGCNFCLGPMVDSLRSDLGHTIAKRARLAIKPSQMHQGALFEVRGSAQPRASAPAANSLSSPSGELQTVPISRFVRRASLSMYHCPPRTAAVLNKLSSSFHASPHEGIIGRVKMLAHQPPETGEIEENQCAAARTSGHPPSATTQWRGINRHFAASELKSLPPSGELQVTPTTS